MRVLAWRAALSMTAAVLGTSAAQAQLIKAGEYPPPKDGFVIPEVIRPLEPEKFFHSPVVSLQHEFGHLESKVTAHPEERDIHRTTASLGFRAGLRGFGMLDLSYATSSIDSKNDPSNGAIAIDADVQDVGLQATGGYLVLPFLAVGASVGRNSASGAYQFAIPVPANDTDGNTMNYAAFAALYYPAGEWMFSLTTLYSYSESVQSYTNNVPADQKAWSRGGSLALSASHPIMARLDGRVGLAWNHVFEQSAFQADRGMDDNWIVPSVGLTYKVTDSTSVLLDAATWLMNSVSNYDSVTLGLSYRF